ncbi:MAG: NHL repeat-containing protein [Candidatus Margulisbacteria bacterium]|nr:NHL repeat-containing protein [Candidatus Margulisiibacteriota bacterium]
MKLLIAACLSIVYCLLFITTSALGLGEAPPKEPVPAPTIELMAEFGRPGASEGDFSSPLDVSVGIVGDLETGLGSLFVADTRNNRVVRLDEDGDFLFQFGRFGIDQGSFNSPAGIAVDFNSRIYVTEKDNDRVQLFDIHGNFVSEIATGEIKYKELNDPAGICVDSYGNIFVADSGNDRVIKFDDLGAYEADFGAFGYGLGFFDNPMDVAVDRDNLIYVVDTNNHRVQVLDYDGQPLRSFGESGKGEGEFYLPQGIAVDDKLIYVADTGNNRVQVFDKDGKFLGLYDGFSAPVGLCVGKSGQLFVADTGNQLIKELKISY